LSGALALLALLSFLRPPLYTLRLTAAAARYPAHSLSLSPSLSLSHFHSLSLSFSLSLILTHSLSHSLSLSLIFSLFLSLLHSLSLSLSRFSLSFLSVSHFLPLSFSRLSLVSLSFLSCSYLVRPSPTPSFSSHLSSVSSSSPHPIGRMIYHPHPTTPPLITPPTHHPIHLNPHPTPPHPTPHPTPPHHPPIPSSYFVSSHSPFHSFTLPPSPTCLPIPQAVGPALRRLSLQWCRGPTDAGLAALRRRRPALCVADYYGHVR
jgi:hypothetical protein